MRDAWVQVRMEVNQAWRDQHACDVQCLAFCQCGVLLDGRDKAVVDAYRCRGVDPLPRVKYAPADEIEAAGPARHARPAACSRSRVLLNARTVSSNSRSPCADDKKPEPWNRCTPSLSMEQASIADSDAGGTLAFSVAASRSPGARSCPNSRWNVELSPYA